MPTACPATRTKAAIERGPPGAVGDDAVCFFLEYVELAGGHAVRVAALEGRNLWLYLVMLFPLIGLGLAWLAAKLWRTRWRIGKPMLELLQTPAGGRYPLRGRIHFTPALGVRLNPSQLMHPVRIGVKLVQAVVSGEDTTESALWEKCVLETALARGTQGVDFSVVLPAGLPSTGTTESTTVKWRLELTTLGADIWFDLPEAGRMAID